MIESRLRPAPVASVILEQDSFSDPTPRRPDAAVYGANRASGNREGSDTRLGLGPREVPWRVPHCLPGPNA